MDPVLVVEDNDDARQFVTVCLEHGGYHVAGAINGQDALDKIDAGLRPCLILLDMMMPVMDGATFAGRLGAMADNSLASTPIVLLTGVHDVDSAQRRAHALDVIRKPIEIDEVIDIVGTHCRR